MAFLLGGCASLSDEDADEPSAWSVSRGREGGGEANVLVSPLGGAIPYLRMR